MTGLAIAAIIGGLLLFKYGWSHEITVFTILGAGLIVMGGIGISA